MSRATRRLSRAHHTVVIPPPPTGTTPDQVSGLVLWLKADALTGYGSGTRVTNWPDASGSGHDAANSTTGDCPTFASAAAGSLPAVYFNGSEGNVLFSSADSSAQAQTFIAVIKPAAVTSAIGRTICGGAAQFRLSVEGYPELLRQSVGGIGVSYQATTTDWQVVTAQFASGQHYHFQHGSIATGTQPLTSFTLAAGSTTSIGRHSGWAEFFDGHIAEIAKWDRLLTQAEIDTVVGGLRSKWQALTPADPAPVPSGTFSGTKVAIVGDSLTDQLGQGVTDVPASLAAAGWPSSSIFFWGVSGKTLTDADSGGKTTMQNIADARSHFGGEPDLWIIQLAGNNFGDSASVFQGKMQQIFDTLGSTARLMWVNAGTANMTDPNLLRCNTVIKSMIEGRAHSYLADWYAYTWNHDQAGWWQDGVHMLPAGYAVKNAWVAARSVEASFV